MVSLLKLAEITEEGVKFESPHDGSEMMLTPEKSIEIQNSIGKSFFIPLPDNKISDWSKLKEFADDNFKFDESGRKLSKRVENTVGKGEIACYEQFLLFPQCFQKACFQRASKGVIEFDWVKLFT